MTEVHHVGLDVLGVVLLELGLIGLGRLLPHLRRVLALPELLEELYHVAHRGLTTLGRVGVNLLCWLKISRGFTTLGRVGIN